MIVTPEEVKSCRKMASNISDDTIAIYIGEAEMLDVVPAIGAAKYRDLDTLPCNEMSGTLPESDILLLDGGYYTDAEGKVQHLAGLKAAICYLAYYRLLLNHSLNVTRFGVVVKEGDESSPASDRAIAAASNESKKIGEAYLAEVVAYLGATADVSHRPAKRITRITPIG